MRTERSLCVEVVGARNLESHQSVDAYCVLQLRPAGRPGEVASSSSSSSSAAVATPSLSRAFRSPTITASADPTWRFAAEFLAPEQPSHARLSVKLFNEKHFFFDMFPRTPNGVPAAEPADAAQDDGRYILDAFTGPGAEAVSACYVDKRPELNLRRRRVPKKLSDDLATADSESDDVLTHSEDEDDDDDFDRSPSPLSSNLTDDVDLHESDEAQDESKESCEVYKSDDESIGAVEINMALLCKPSRVATDSWYMLRGVNSGEVRIRTIWVDGWMEPLTSAEREALFAQHITGAEPMRDQYGFAIPEQSRRLWTHLKSYNDCRERRRIDEWKNEFSDQLPEVIHRDRQNPSGSSAYTKVLQLARGGIPRFWRERVYMSVSGARQKQIDAGPDYYASLVRQTETLDTATFRQIELDIDRTFGHSGTTICTDSGRARLRRILRAYSLRNPDVGYCQGLNFIVGFLTLIAEEENAFWLLIVICEELFPGYYTPSMSDIQTDMLVLKQLIAEELPNLDEFTDDVGLPLELLGSQWLLCLFTTTFPSETVFRIFDCILTEGSHFVFPVIIAHLRRLEPILLELDDFHDVLAAIKGVENGCFDADEFIAAVSQEAERIRSTRVAELRLKHRDNVRDEMQRAERVRALNQQLAIAYEIPAFSPYASSLLRFYEEAEGSSRSDVAFILTLLCHGLVWIAERSKSWTR